MTNVISIFPSPIYVDKFECSEELKSWFDKQPMKSTALSAEYGDVSEDTYVLDAPECRFLKKFILEHISRMSNEILGKNVKSFGLSQSWISHKKPNQFHMMHSHQNSFISGVYYYEYDSEDLPAIRFHKTAHTATHELRVQSDSGNSRFSEYAWDYYDFHPTKNTLILFPSNLSHSVPLNTTNKVRKSLAFNAIPLGSLGDKGSLNELLFDRFI